MNCAYSRRVAAYVLPFALACGCGASSRYHTAPKYPGELVWRYDDQLTLAKDGRRITDLANLSAEVTCVPRSVQDSVQAKELEGSGSIWAGVGTGVLLVGVVASAALLIAGAVNHDNGLLYGGLGALGGGLFIGGSALSIGSSQLVDSFALRLDAVNRYNDVVARGGCSPSKLRQDVSPDRAR
jgi:hypothetical protein